MLPVSLVHSACDILEAARPILVDAFLADLYQNNFWKIRYDDYGRDFHRTDAQYHLNYLITALKLGQTDIYANYWANYRPVMVLRGACTRHVHELIDSTARPVALALQDGFPLVEPCFSAAHKALDYPQPFCQALRERQADIIECVAAQWCPDESRRAPYRRDLQYHLSYLEDTVVAGKPELFRQYLEWVCHFLMESGLPPKQLVHALALLDRALQRYLTPEMAAPFLAVLRGAFEGF